MPGTEETATFDTGSSGDPLNQCAETERSSRHRNGRTTANQQPNQTLFYIGGHNGGPLVEPVLLELGWKRTQDKNAEGVKMRWTECVTQAGYSTFREGEQLINHIPNCGLITNKLGLLMSLRDYDRMCRTMRNKAPNFQISDFLPDTFIIDDRNEREAFFQTHKEGDIWINKPSGSNQGKGIFMVRDIEEFKKHLAERDEESKGNPRGLKARLMQRYLKRPLLLEGKKFDIRSFMMISCTTPYLVFFHPGYIRLALTQFSNEDENIVTHLTNQYIQKKDPNYQANKNDTIWSMEKFSDYIQTTYAYEKNLDDDWVKHVLNRQMQRIMTHVFNSVKNKFGGRIGIFELYGFDFMIDEDMKVWLIEVNVNPAMHINCDVLKEVLPPMIEETLHISLECFEKARKGKVLTPVAAQKKFSIIYNEANFSRNAANASPQNSLRYWVPPRFRSHSTSPTRSQEQQENNNTMSQPVPSKPPFVSSTNIGLPRVAQNLHRNFETSLRSYQKIERPLQSTSLTTTSVNMNANNRQPLSNKIQPRIPITSAKTKRAVSQQEVTEQKPGEHDIQNGSEGESIRPSAPAPLRSTIPLRPRVQRRPSPPQRAPAPITKVQVLTGNVRSPPGIGQRDHNTLPASVVNHINRQQMMKSQEYRAKKRHQSPLDRSS